MVGDTVGADVHAGGDLIVVQSLGDQVGHGLLGAGQAVPPARSPRRRSITASTACAAAAYPCAPRVRATASRRAVAAALRQPAACQVDAGTQQGQRRLRRDTLQRRIVRGAEDVRGRHSSRHNMHERVFAAQCGDAYFTGWSNARRIERCSRGRRERAKAACCPCAYPPFGTCSSRCRRGAHPLRADGPDGRPSG